MWGLKHQPNIMPQLSSTERFESQGALGWENHTLQQPVIFTALHCTFHNGVLRETGSKRKWQISSVKNDSQLIIGFMIWHIIWGKSQDICFVYTLVLFFLKAGGRRRNEIKQKIFFSLSYLLCFFLFGLCHLLMYFVLLIQ